MKKTKTIEQVIDEKIAILQKGKEKYIKLKKKGDYVKAFESLMKMYKRV